MIIFISGSINSGKSTVSKILADELGEVALVEVDLFRSFIEWMPIEEAAPLSLENAAGVIKNFARRNISVIVPYPLSQRNYEYLLENLKEYKNSIYVFILSPQEDMVLTNRGSRELDGLEKERIKYHYEIGIHNPGFGNVIDNTNQTPHETAEHILKTIQSSQ